LDLKWLVLWTDKSNFPVYGHLKKCTHSVLCLLWCMGVYIMIFECFSVDGIGDRVRIDGILKEEYRKILEINEIPSGLHLNGLGIILMQDNDPKHSSKLCQVYIMKKENCGDLRNMDCVSQFQLKLDRNLQKKRVCGMFFRNHRMLYFHRRFKFVVQDCLFGQKSHKLEVILEWNLSLILFFIFI